MPISDDNLTTSHESVTLLEFEAMAKHGRIHMAADDAVEPSEEDLSNAQSPVDLGGCMDTARATLRASISGVVAVSQILLTKNTSAI
jgi:hypothetical protein